MSAADPASWRDRAPVILGCAGPRLEPEERRLFEALRPVGFILFARNVESPAQLRDLVAELRAASGAPDAAILIDQEGGRVARLKPPHWRAPPPAARFGELYARAPEAGLQAARLNAELIGRELSALGIDVDCLPLLDVPQPDADPVIGDRAFCSDPQAVAALGRAVVEGLARGGCQPVIKHLPGHGRSRADTHVALARVEVPAPVLEAVDFLPFRLLNDAPWGMTAHLVYPAYDPELPATFSPAVIERAIRGAIGFDGVLMSDDIGMGALSGSMAERSRAALAAGCDLVLHCSGRMAEMQEVAAALPPMAPASAARLARTRAARPAPPAPRDTVAAVEELQALLASA